MKRALIAAVLSVGLVVLSGPWSVAIADDDDKGNYRLKAVPFVFVGTADDCTPAPAGSNIVTSAWLGGMGLPDNGGQNTTAADLATNPNKQDPHLGLLLSKNGPTADCSAAGARIKGVKGTEVTSGFHLGFDYRNGGHCGAGAPRFNVVSKSGSTETFHFVGGCSNGTATTAPQDPAQWTRVRFDTSNPAQSFPPIPTGNRIKSITLIYDEGTDSPGNPKPPSDPFDDPSGIGLAVVDNLDINDKTIPRGSGIQPSPGDDDNHDANDDDDK